LWLDGEDKQIADSRKEFGAGEAVDRVSRSQFVARFATRINHVDIGCCEALLQHAADQRVGHVAATKESNFHV